MQEIERYKLGNPKSFHYLNQSNCYELDGVNDAHEYLETRRAMDIVGISEHEQVCFLHIYDSSFLCTGLIRILIINNILQEAIFRVVAAILHLGNVNFAKGKEIDSSVIKDEKSRFHLTMTAELLRYVLLGSHICEYVFLLLKGLHIKLCYSFNISSVLIEYIG